MQAMKSLTKRSSDAPPSMNGKTDLLLRFFESQFFDEWIALMYLYQNNQPGVQDYLCNKLYDLPAEAREKYLLQLVYLAVARPGSPLERTIIDLCHRSFQVSIKVYWLLLALSQDSPRNKAIEALRDACERAALDGKWEVPFLDPRLAPLSPPGGRPRGAEGPAFGPPPLLTHVPPAPIEGVGIMTPMLEPPPRMTMGSSPPPQEAAISSMVAMHKSVSAKLLSLGGWFDDEDAFTPEPRRYSSPARSLQTDLDCLASLRSRGRSLSYVPDSRHRPLSAAALPAPQAVHPFVPPAVVTVPPTPMSVPSADACWPAALPTLRTAAPVPPAPPAVPLLVTADPPLQPTAKVQRQQQQQPSPQQLLLSASVAVTSPHAQERYNLLRLELGEGEGVSALLEKSSRHGECLVAAYDGEAGAVDRGVLCGGGDGSSATHSCPLSPTTRLRHDTFGASVQFIEALCDASAALTSIPQDQRARALRNGLDSINRDIEAATQRDVAIWFPLAAHKSQAGRRQHERVLRLSTRDAALLNSRDKAPFLLFVEVLEEEDGEEECAASGAAGTAGISKNGGAPLVADSATSVMGDRFKASSNTLFGETTTPTAVSPTTATVAHHTNPHRQLSPVAHAPPPLPLSPPPPPSHGVSTPDMGPEGPVSVVPPLLPPAAIANAAAAAGGTAVAVAPSSTVLASSSHDHGASAGAGQPLCVSVNVPSSDPTTQVAVRQDVPPSSGTTAAQVARSSASISVPQCASTDQQVVVVRQHLPHMSSISFSGTVSGMASGIAANVARSLCFMPSGVSDDEDEHDTHHHLSPVCGSAPGGTAVTHVPPVRQKAGSMEGRVSPVRGGRGGSRTKSAGSGGGGYGGGHTAVAVANVALLQSAPPPVGIASAGVTGLTVARSLPLASTLGHSAANRKADGQLTEEELGELISSGCLSPPAKSDQILASKIASAMASLRGEAPLLRVQIQVLPAARAAAADSAAATAPTSHHSGPMDAASQGSGGLANSFLGSLTKRSSAAGGTHWPPPAAALAAAAPPPPPPPPAAGGADIGAEGGSRTMAFLSKLGLYRNSSTSSSTADSSAKEAGQLAGQAAVGDKAAQAPERLVSLRLEYAASDLNLAVASPYRKSRRMPSQEAINFMAEKYKVERIPPPYQSGPPLQLPPPCAAADAAAAITPLTWASLPAHACTGLFSPVAEAANEGAVCSPNECVSPPALLSPPAGLLSPPSVVAAAAVAQAADGGTNAAAMLSAAAATVPVAAVATAGGDHRWLDAVSSQLRSLLGSSSSSQTKPAPAGVAAVATDAGSRTQAVAPGVEVDVWAAAASGNCDLQTGVPPPCGTSPLHSVHLPQGVDLSQSNEVALPDDRHVCGKGGAPADVKSEASSHSVTGASPSGASPTDGASCSFVTAGGSALPDACPAVGGTGLSSLSPASFTLPAALTPTAAQATNPAANGTTAVPPVPPAVQMLAAVPPTVQPAVRPSVPPLIPPAVPPPVPPAESLAQQRQREACAVYGERWDAKVQRIQRDSPQGRRKGWALRCLIVKSGDDCRQELLAMQLIRTFHDIFQLSELPLYVRLYEVLVTSNRTALIELVPDALSIHTLKSRSPPNTSFSDHFFAKFGRGTPGCVAAQRRFTESLAAYSIINYMLQIKDRHNGNVLVDDLGHLVHIDFGFMLSNSPGGVNFETAPFKLTRELLEVMDSNSEGKPSELFDYFKVLVIQGFLACRKYHDRILLLVRIMARSNFPCFKVGERAVKSLEKRFQLSMTEVQCVQHVLALISDSLDAWRTRQYDYYQRVLNGIL